MGVIWIPFEVANYTKNKQKFRQKLEIILGYEDCSKNPCQDGTICLDTKEGFTCICAPWQEDCTRC